MRHLVAGKPLNVDSQHRLALRRNLARSLFLHDRIVTTPAKAKAVRGFVERLITRARKAVVARDAKDKGAWLHQVRTIARDIPDKVALRRLLTEIAPRSNRPGGYTRIVRDWKNQVGDNAPRVIFELVDKPVAAPEAPAEGSAEAKKAKKAAKAAAAKA
ncbi:MAG: 50S ribosomal protein L17 [Planctomycetota bacterium]